MDPVSNQPTNHPVVWQLVIARPIAELLQVENYLKPNCDKYVGQQHDADEEVNRTHTHYSLVNYRYTKQALSKQLNKLGFIGSDNFGILTVWPKEKIPYDEVKLAEYVIKGLNAPDAHYSGYSPERIESFRNNWINHKEIGKDGQTNTNTKKRTLVQYKLTYESPSQQKLRKSDQVKNIEKRISELETEKQRPLVSSEIRDIIRRMLVEWDETIGIYKVLDIYDTILMRRQNPVTWNQMFDDLLEKRKCRV